MVARRHRERSEDLRPARARRRRFSLRREVELHQAGRAKAGLPHLQRGRIRARHVQGSLHHSPGSAPADRGDVDLLLRAQRAAPPTSTSAANSPKARRSSSARSKKRGRKNFLGKNILGTGFDVRDLRPSRRRRLHLRRGNRPDRIARRQARLSAHQAALFPRRPRPLHVPDDREQRRDALPREAHHRDGRRGIRQARHAEQHRHAHRLRQRRCAEARLLRNRSRHGHDGPGDQRNGGGPKPGRKFKAVIPGGSSAKVLRADETFQAQGRRDETRRSMDIPMDFDSLAAGRLDGRLRRRHRAWTTRATWSGR